MVGFGGTNWQGLGSQSVWKEVPWHSSAPFLSPRSAVLCWVSTVPGFPLCLVSERIPSLNGPRQRRWEKPCSWPWTSILTGWWEAEPWEKGQRGCQPLGGSARGAEKDGVALCGPGQPKCPRARGRLRNIRANTVHICLVLNGVCLPFWNSQGWWGLG